MENLEIKEELKDNCVLLVIAGNLNSYTYGEFESKIYASIKKAHVVLDLSQVTNMSSSGLGVLMSAHDEGADIGNQIFILNPSEIVRLAIDSTGFSDMFKVIHSIDELKK
ncbi:MAG: STAS domain-containing protein [Spirochaetaceae bacterium]|nr:STAS domain-containing protein [Spirochaetaceae bacterium]